MGDLLQRVRQRRRGVGSGKRSQHGALVENDPPKATPSGGSLTDFDSAALPVSNSSNLVAPLQDTASLLLGWQEGGCQGQMGTTKGTGWGSRAPSRAELIMNVQLEGKHSRALKWTFCLFSKQGEPKSPRDIPTQFLPLVFLGVSFFSFFPFFIFLFSLQR